jgi:hypothetical protein
VRTAPPDDTGDPAGEDGEEGEGDAEAAGGADGAGGAGVVAVVVAGADEGDAEVVAGEGMPATTAGDVSAPALTAGEADGDTAAASLASARFTAPWVSSWPELPVMPWPSSETARRHPAVAVPAPISQATTPKRMRLFTLQLRTRADKGRLRPL